MKGRHSTETMSTPRVDRVTWQAERGGQQFLYPSKTSHKSTTLPSVTGHVNRTGDQSRQQQRPVGKLPEWSHYSDLELSSRPLDGREMSLPELNRHTQMMSSRRLPPAHAADKWMKHWSSELSGTHNRRSWRQSTDGISHAQSGVLMPEDHNHEPKTNCRQLANSDTTTTLWRSSSTKGLLTDTALMPVVARRPSLSMDSLTDKHSLVIIGLLFKFMLNCICCNALLCKVFCQLYT